jgi:hypothetical protein
MSKLGHDVFHAVFGTANNVNKFAHGVVLLFFSVACWFVWVLLRLPAMVRLKGVAWELPAFTRFCMSVGPPLLIGLGAVATVYCLWVWFSRAEAWKSWVGFLAVATGVLFILMLPVIVALYLPLVDALHHVAVI